MATRRYDIVLCRRNPEELTLDMLAARAAMHPKLVERFVEFGLIEPVGREGARLLFDAAAVLRLRAIGRLRDGLGLNLAGVAVVLDLVDRCRALKRENEMLRTGL
jgi:DNA-binding transcriptional MerR regulator